MSFSPAGEGSYSSASHTLQLDLTGYFEVEKEREKKRKERDRKDGRETPFQT